jgi:hypothetical protein
MSDITQRHLMQLRSLSDESLQPDHWSESGGRMQVHASVERYWPGVPEPGRWPDCIK